MKTKEDIKQLIEKENVETKDILGMTPLLYASWYGHLDIVKYLL